MDAIDFLLQLSLILFTGKILGILLRRIGLPQVLGYILAGIFLGPAIWEMIFDIPAGSIVPITAMDNPYLKAFAEVGVIFVMFTAGLETNLKDIRSAGMQSFLIALLGVLIPLGAGIGIGALFLPESGFFTWLFIGVIMTATSVGITVEVLRELGKLQTRVGTIILSAAIIDDVLGIIVLAIALSLSGANSSTSAVLSAINPNNEAWISIIWILAFFVFAVGVGFGISKLFKYIEKKTPHTRRIPILSIAVCFAYAYIAEKVFGVADITGAFIAGVVLSTRHDSAEYTDRKVTINSYTVFAPIFFASIGIKITFAGLSLDVLWFALAFVAVAIATKIIGCGGMAKAMGFKWKDSARVGVGMIARGEVALIVMEKGIAGGLIGAQYRAIVVMLVLVSSLLAPILLKILYRNDKTEHPLPTKEQLDGVQYEQTN
ncbi:MAG: cation:proton antiporter [Clostridiales bacterium]|nr:cation:proton antiporter [Clostridiales bacterium]